MSTEPAFRPYDTCAHGKVRGWEGVAQPGERLPVVEWCPICDPDILAMLDRGDFD